MTEVKKEKLLNTQFIIVLSCVLVLVVGVLVWRHNANSVTVDPSEGVKVVTVDMNRLVKAAMATSIMEGKGAQVDPNMLGKEVRDQVAFYKDRGFLVLASNLAIAVPEQADITPAIAAKLHIDLSRVAEAEKLLNGEAPTTGAQ